jgi:hypothetical protein
MLHLVLAALVVGAPTDGDRDGEKKAAQTAPTTESAAETASPIFRTGLAPSAVAVEAGQAEQGRIATALDETITNDTFAFGRPQEGTFLKLWTSYAWGQIEEMYDAAGNESVPYTIATIQTVDFNGDGTPDDLNGDGVPESFLTATDATVTTQRFIAGAQINPLDFRRFKLGVGAQGIFGQNEVEPVANGAGVGTFDSGFALQSVKVFGVLEGKTLGVHGGYVFDLGPEEERDALRNFSGAPNSAEQDAWFVGGSFDLPTDWVRLFGGIDYYRLQEANAPNDGAQTLIYVANRRPDLAANVQPVDEGNDLIFFNFGMGFQLSFFEIGASAMLRTQLQRTAAADELYANALLPQSFEATPAGVGSYLNTVYGAGPDGTIGTSDDVTGNADTARYPSGGHHGSIIPYLIVRPPSLPVALSVRGGVTNQFGDYGFSVGGANDFVTREGFTVALSYGF